MLYFVVSIIQLLSRISFWIFCDLQLILNFFKWASVVFSIFYSFLGTAMPIKKRSFHLRDLVSFVCDLINFPLDILGLITCLSLCVTSSILQFLRIFCCVWLKFPYTRLLCRHLSEGDSIECLCVGKLICTKSKALLFVSMGTSYSKCQLTHPY